MIVLLLLNDTIYQITEIDLYTQTSWLYTKNLQTNKIKVLFFTLVNHEIESVHISNILKKLGTEIHVCVCAITVTGVRYDEPY